MNATAQRIRREWPAQHLFKRGLAKRLMLERVRPRPSATLSVTYKKSRNPSKLALKFEALCQQWRENTLNYSSMDDIVNDSAYQRIVGMGPAVVPLIINKLTEEPDHWFRALYLITGHYPISPENEGNLTGMTADWLKFAGKEGYLPLR